MNREETISGIFEINKKTKHEVEACDNAILRVDKEINAIYSVVVGSGLAGGFCWIASNIPKFAPYLKMACTGGAWLGGGLVILGVFALQKKDGERKLFNVRGVHALSIHHDAAAICHRLRYKEIKEDEGIQAQFEYLGKRVATHNTAVKKLSEYADITLEEWRIAHNSLKNWDERLDEVRRECLA